MGELRQDLRDALLRGRAELSSYAFAAAERVARGHEGILVTAERHEARREVQAHVGVVLEGERRLVFLDAGRESPAFFAAIPSFARSRALGFDHVRVELCARATPG